MRSSLPKVLHPLGGRPMLGHVLATADALDSYVTAVVLAETTREQVERVFGQRYAYVVQRERLGTGHAVLQARAALRDRSDDVVVLFGDTPLARPETVRAVVEARRVSGARVALLSFHADPPTGYGRVVRDGAGRVTQLVEERGATPEQRALTEANSGIMCFDAAWLWDVIETVPRNAVKHEYYLTNLVEMAVAQFGPGAAIAQLAADPTEALGINDRTQLAAAERVLRGRTLEALMRSGVTIVDPEATYVDVGVRVGGDTTLLPGTMLCGATQIGGGCIIGPQTTLRDALIGDAVTIQHSVIERVQIPSGTSIGPFVYRSSRAIGEE